MYFAPLGIDALAHTAALKVGLPTIAIPGSGLSDDVLYPKSNRPLASEILEAGGSLISEFDDDFKAAPWSFPKRNRIMAALSHATLVIEAEEKSGTLITARLAMEYNRDVMAVPGSLFSPTSAGTHNLIKDGATPIRSAEEICEVLKLSSKENQETLFPVLSENENKLLTLLNKPQTKEYILSKLSLPHHSVEGMIESLVSKKIIRERMGTIERCN